MAIRFKYSLEDLNRFAKKKGGRCLSKMFQGIFYKHKWICKNKHTWEAVPAGLIHRGTWCPACAGRPHLTLKDCQEYAKKQNGTLLSKLYVNTSTKLKWRCRFGHIWKAAFGNMRSQKQWCPKCSGNTSYNLTDCTKVAKKRSGKLLSKKYVGVRSLLQWRCHLGHTWRASFANVKGKGSWCPICAWDELGRSLRNSIEDLRKWAISKGGLLLSTEYTRADNKYLWRCGNGHEWSASAALVMNHHTWCPFCTHHSQEACTRICFEKIFSSPFPRIRPEWLRVKGGRKLELDGYNPELRIAFEHQGRQHINRVDFFHRTTSSFRKRRLYDLYKTRVCHKKGIRLIHVPELTHSFRLEGLKDFIIKRCRSLKIRIPRNAEARRINYASAFVISPDFHLKRLKEAAIKKGGSCIAKKWLGWNAFYTFKCKCGYLWKAPANRILSSPSWCIRCGHKRTLAAVKARNK